jgi:hypothetical protein
MEVAMPRSFEAHRFLLAAGAMAVAGCMTVKPAPLVSHDSYRLGIASCVFHRDVADVAEATRRAMEDLSLHGVEQRDETGRTEIAALNGDNRRVRVDLEWEKGTPEGTPLPLIGVITRARVKIGNSGERALSRKLLDRMAYHLRHPPTPSSTGDE